MNSTGLRETYAAVVHGPGGVHFIAVCADREGLWRRLGSYVGAWAPYQLGKTESESVAAALRQGDHESAVRVYFQNVGQWDSEALVIEKLDSDGVSGIR